MNNTTLIKHGIQTEQSHLRAHVCPKAHKVYVFPTQAALDIMSAKQYRLVTARQPGIDIVTAKGYLVPPFDIEQCVAITLRPGVWDMISWSDSTYWKGRQATILVMGLIKKGLFPIPRARSK